MKFKIIRNKNINIIQNIIINYNINNHRNNKKMKTFNIINCTIRTNKKIIISKSKNNDKKKNIKINNKIRNNPNNKNMKNKNNDGKSNKRMIIIPVVEVGVDVTGGRGVEDPMY